MSALLTQAPDAIDAERGLSRRPRGIRPQPAYARVGALLLRRIKYIAAVLYWAVRHRSLSHGKWLAAYQGFTWS